MKLEIVYKIIFTFFLISQYNLITEQNNFLATITYTLLLLILSVDMLYYLYKIYKN